MLSLRGSVFPCKLLIPVPHIHRGEVPNSTSTSMKLAPSSFSAKGVSGVRQQTVSYLLFCCCRVQQVTAPVSRGEQVMVCGDAAFLGGWKPEKALPLYTTPADYPVWNTKVGVQAVVR